MNYKVLNKINFSQEEYKITPIRNQDRYDIMKWRNEQIFHLRQTNLLSKEDQDHYFNTEVNSLFEQEHPEQLLFSFLKEDQCLGYGGLVHIDWTKKKAEISFLMDSTLEDIFFESLWTIFLNLIETVAFDHLQFHKIFTYSFAVRPRLYPVLKRQSFIAEEQRKDAIEINNKWEDIWIHTKFRDKLSYKHATLKDSKQLFEWANELTTRKNSINKEIINWDHHQEWFKMKLAAKEVSKIFIFFLENPIGVLRLDKINEVEMISFSVDKKYRGRGYGFRMINQILNDFPKLNFIAEVFSENESSHKIFIKNGFKVLENIKKTKVNIVRYQKLKNE